MPFENILGFEHGLVNRPDPRTIKLLGLRGLSKAQNISVDKMGRIIGIGGLGTHGEVPTHAAIMCPGAGLFPYGSDHWRGTETVVDLLANNNATADRQTEADATTGWSGGTLTSDTPANYGIASNGTTYVMKALHAGGGKTSQSFTTVIGQRYLFSVAAYWGGIGYLNIIIRNNAGSEILLMSPPFTTASWAAISGEFVAKETTTDIRLNHVGANSFGYWDDVYLTKVPKRDIDTTWLALANVANAQVDIYNSSDRTFTNDTAALDFGTVASFVGASAGNLDFPTVNTITDSKNSFLAGNISAGKVYKISGCSTTTANNILFVADRVTAGTITARGNPFTVQASEGGTVTLTEYNPADFHFVDDSLSVSPAGGGIALRPKQYRFVDRIHFSGAGAVESKFQDWYLNDVGLVAPTDIAAEADAGDQDASALSAGLGFEIGITTTADGGEWPAGTYIIANSFIYDDGQESELYIPSTDEEFGTAIVDNDSLTITARAKGPYDERISGGRIYARLDESDDPWVLLVDISIERGARATLSGQYNSWNESTTANVAHSTAFKSIRLNVDAYEGLTGFSPDAKIETFTSNNKFWDVSVIAGNRCFIFGPRYTDSGGKTVHFRDRILYSKINQYDVFPIDNYIDVTGSDAEDYVAGGVYGSDLLAFKQNTLYIIDISDPLEFRMKQDKNKGKHPFRGISRPGAYFETPHGPAWCNQFGIWLYDGNEVIDLLGDRVERSKHPLAYQGYMEFDGTNDYISKSNDANLNFGAATDFSLECIFRSTETDHARFIAKGLSASGGVYALGMNNGGKIITIIHDGANNVTTAWDTAGFNDGEWHHVVATFDRDGTVQAYVDGDTDGTAVSISSVGDIDDVGRSFLIGQEQSNTLPLDGDIALIRVWTGLLDSTDVTNLNNGAPASSISNATLKLEWKPSGFSDATATDDSGNSLDGTVSGATFIYPDTWEHFWTDYSILGYHGKTNQLIIMRDCTGKWSSGQDYGDCVIVDLDTMAYTTGRRVFTKGATYTNWATDWNGDLIIGRQSSSNIITEKWTDKPQSQAVGLIDIRTPDLTGARIATIDAATDLIVHYKSSAAQTKPISTAVDGNDLPTAWTRQTGNFSASTAWQRLVIALGGSPIDFASLRLKVDNPTNAGDIEIGPISVMYTENATKLS